MEHSKEEVIQNLKNILGFIPFGVLFPVKKWNVALIAVLVFSISIELIQYAFALGWCEVDDVISNSIGAMIGFGLWIIFKKMKRKTDAT